MKLDQWNIAVQVFLGSIPVLIALVIGNWNNNSRLTSIETSLNARITSLEVSLNKRIDSLEVSLGKRIDDLKTYVTEELRDIKQRLTNLENNAKVIR